MPKVPGTPGAPAAGPSEAKARKPRTNPGPGSYKRKPKPTEPEVAASDTLETGKNLTTGQWLDVIDFVKSHPDMTQEAVCVHFRSKGWKLKQGTLSKNLKREDQLRQQALATSNGPNTKRARIVTCPEVERALLLWFRAMEERGESPTGAMLVEKRRRFEIAMDIPPERRLSGEGWVASFKKAYGIREHRRHGEAGSVDPRDVAQERERIRPIIAQYAPRDCFNGDEGALFAYAPPDRGLSSKRMSGKKISKFRITLLFVCNQDGSEKEPLMFIGRYKKPRCFGGKNAPPHGHYYRNNSKAWMTAVLFEEYIKQLDAKMRRQGRHILLTLDNFSGHSIGYQPTNIRIEFFAPNMTSHVQPLDAGIIRAFKAHYRRTFCLRALDADEAGEDDIWSLNLLEAMGMAKEAWAAITPATIAHCWAHTGILPLSAPAIAVPAIPKPVDAVTAAWEFVEKFFSSPMALPEAQIKLKHILGVGTLDATWQRALSLANDFDHNDDDEVSTARRALDDLRAKCAVIPSQASAAADTRTKKPSQLCAAEAGLQRALDDLKERKLIRNPLPLDDYLDPADERAVGEGVHELLTDADVVAAVRAEMAGPTAADEAEDSDDEGKDEPMPPSEMLTLCDRLLAGCRDHAVGNLLDLTKELMAVKRQMRALQASTVKQTSLTTFWKPVSRPADSGGSPSAADSPIVLD